MSVGSDQHRTGRSDRAEYRELPHAVVPGVDQPNPIGPWFDVEAAGFAEVEEHGPGIVQQVEDSRRTVRCLHVEVGHAPPEQRVSLPQVVVDVETGEHRSDTPTRLVHAQQFGHDLPERLVTVVGATECDRRHGVVQHPGADRMAFGVVGVEEALGRRRVDHLGQLPSEVHGVLHPGVEALTTLWGMHVRGIPGQQHTAAAVGHRLARHVGEPRDPPGAVHPEIRPVHGDERLAEFVQAGVAGMFDLPFREHDPDRLPRFPPTDGMGADAVVTEAELRFLGHLDLGDHPAGRRVQPGEVDTGFLADQTASSVAADEVLRPERRGVGQLDLDSGVVLGEAHHLTLAKDRNPERNDPISQDGLKEALPQRQHVIVAGGEVADVQRDLGERQHMADLPRREEPLRDATLVEHLDRAGMQPARPRSVDILVGASLDDDDVDPRQRQLTSQHQPGRASSCDDHGMVVASPLDPVARTADRPHEPSLDLVAARPAP